MFLSFITYRNSACKRNDRHDAVRVPDVNGAEMNNIGTRNANDHGKQGRKPHARVANAETVQHCLFNSNIECDYKANT